MTPGARLQAAIELLAAIDTQRGAADDIVGGYFRSHRFAGSKDRAAISEHIYAVLRQRAVLDWWIVKLTPDAAEADSASPEQTARLRLFGALLLIEEWTLADIEEACDGDRFRPLPLNNLERRFTTAAARHTLLHPEMPDAVQAGYPEWLDPMLREIFGDRLGFEMAALNKPAPLDLRANALKASRNEARSLLSSEKITTELAPLSPLGLRVWTRIPLSTLEAFKSGAIEVQDEGSQLAAMLSGVKPGMRVVDFCAGAGGKTLAIAALMRNRGNLIACDVSAHRLERAAQRFRRAGISNVERRTLSSERDKWVKHHAGGFDRVFIDAPCTGTGTWRRNPDAKWRLKPQDIEELADLQSSILDSASRLAKPGGRVIYATCSVLPRENDRQIENFLGARPEFSLVPIAEVWAETIGSACPVRGDTLQLTPARHGTDGFFVAVLQHNASSAAETPSDPILRE